MKRKGTAGGSLFCGILAVAFIALKACGVIDWSWLWVLSPIWIPTGLALVFILFVFFVLLVYEINVAKRRYDIAKQIDKDGAQYGLERRPGESNIDFKRRIAFFKQDRRRATHDERHER